MSDPQRKINVNITDDIDAKILEEDDCEHADIHLKLHYELSSCDENGVRTKKPPTFEYFMTMLETLVVSTIMENSDDANAAMGMLTKLTQHLFDALGSATGSNVAVIKSQEELVEVLGSLKDGGSSDAADVLSKIAGGANMKQGDMEELLKDLTPEQRALIGKGDLTTKH